MQNYKLNAWIMECFGSIIRDNLANKAIMQIGNVFFFYNDNGRLEYFPEIHHWNEEKMAESIVNDRFN